MAQDYCILLHLLLLPRSDQIGQLRDLWSWINEINTTELMKSPKLPFGSAASTSSSSLCRTLTQGSSLAFTGWIFYGSSRFSVLKCKNSSSHQMLLFKKFECKKLHVGSTSSFIFVVKIANSKTSLYKYSVLKSGICWLELFLHFSTENWEEP